MATASVACFAAATGFPALDGLAALRKTTRLRSAPAQTRFSSQSTYAFPDARFARVQEVLGRKTIHRGRLCFIRAATRPSAALL
jgi:hypothetical protein